VPLPIDTSGPGEPVTVVPLVITGVARNSPFEPPSKLGALREATGRGSDVGPPAKPVERVLASKRMLPPNTFLQQTVLAAGLSEAALEQLLKLTNASVEPLAAPGLVRLTVQGMDALTAVEQAARQFPEADFGLDFVYHKLALDAVPPKDSTPVLPTAGCKATGCFGPKAIHWQEKLADCARGLGIGVIDTMPDMNHPAFIDRKKYIWPIAVDRTEKTAKPGWHGTSVLSLLAGSPTSSTPGLIPDANFIVVDPFYVNQAGQPETTTARLAVALSILAGEHKDIKVDTKVVNMSLVGPHDDILHRRIARMAARGIVFVAAAGNGGPGGSRGYPAAYDEVLAVTAIDDKGLSYDNANHGDYIDMAAPGVRVRAALPDGREGLVSGTSFAVPFVTAIAAVTYRDTSLNYSMWVRRPPLTPVREMLERLKIDPIGGVKLKERDPVYGFGMVRAPHKCTGSDGWITSMRAGGSADDAQPARSEAESGHLWKIKVVPASGG
jgi:hypothetical protein